MRPTTKVLVACFSVVTMVGLAIAMRGQSQPSSALPDHKLRYWKGNLHTHTLWSDGDDFPEMVADWYKRHGYDFLGLSDHNILSEGVRWISAAESKGSRDLAVQKYLARFGEDWVERRTVNDKTGQAKAQVRLKPLREFRHTLEESGRFLMVQTEEITHRYAKAPVHMNAINLRDVIHPINGESVEETIRVNLRQVAEQQKKTGWKILAVVNHPNYKWGLRAEDMVDTPELRYFEVFNGHSGVANYGDETHASTERMWDIILALRLGKLGWPVLYGTATDDAHRYHKWGVGIENPGRGWIMVRSRHLTAESLIRAVEEGDFYASTGVILNDVRHDGNEFRLSIRAEPGVSYKTQFIATLRGTSFDSTPVMGKDGKPLEVTRLYSSEIGKVIAESDSLTPAYRTTGREYYVRAKVISTKAHPNPFQKGDVEVAWTQPIVP